MDDRRRKILGLVAAAVALALAGLAHAQAPDPPNTRSEGGKLPDKHVHPQANAHTGNAISTVSLPNNPTMTTSSAPLPVDVTAVQLKAMTEGQTAELRCVGKIIDQVRLQGCVDSACADQQIYDRAVSLTDLLPGQHLEAGQLGLAQLRLTQLGYFRQVTASCLPNVRGNAHIEFAVIANQLVRGIEITGNSEIFQSELRNKLLLRPGDVLNSDDPAALSLLERQRNAIVTLYQREGFDNANVTVTSDALRRGEVAVHIAIVEGPKQRVTQTRITILPQPPPSDAEEAAGLVCPNLTESAILQASELAAVDTYTKRQETMARNKVRTYLRGLGYGSPGVTVGFDTADQAIHIEVRQGRCNLVRVFVREEVGAEGAGYALSEERALYSALPFAESGLFEFDEADRGREDLAGVFENRGYLFADVRLDFRVVPRELGGEVENAITYYVTTGYISQVRGISFPGHERFSKDALAAVLGSKAYSFFDAGGYAQIDKILADLDVLRAFYRKAGFFQFRYELALPEGVTATSANHRTRIDNDSDTIFRYRFADKGFQIRQPKGEAFIYIDIPIGEGLRTRLRELRVEGVQQLPARDIHDLLKLSNGDVISYDMLVKGLTAVEQRYRNAGFFRMEIAAHCSSHKPDRADAVCTAENLLAEDVDVRVVVNEGARVDIGEAFVIGNFDTQSDVILRDLPASGRPYSADDEFEAKRRLRNLGLFNQVTFQYIGADEKPSRKQIALVVQVVENRARSIEYSPIGLQTINNLRTGERTIPALVDSVGHGTSAADMASIGASQGVKINLPNLLLTSDVAYIDKNFLHSGKSLRIPLKIGVTVPAEPVCETPAKERCETTHFYDFMRLVSFLPQYADSRLFGSDFALRVTGYAVRDYASQGYDIDKVGGLFEISRRFGRLSTSLGLDVGKIRTRLWNEYKSDEAFQLAPAYQLVPSISYDNTDSPLNPTTGFSLNARFPLINAYQKNVLTAALEHGNYLLVEGTGKAFVPVGSGLVFATLLHAGSTKSLGGDTADLPSFARFRLGGHYGLRGYTDLGIRQYDATGETIIRTSTQSAGSVVSQTVGDGNVVLNGSLEMRFPLARDLGVWGTVFWDWGGIAEDWSVMHSVSIRHGVGVGITWLLSGQIPIRADYGIAIGNRFASYSTTVIVDGQPAREYDQFGVLNVGILYSF